MRCFWAVTLLNTTAYILQILSTSSSTVKAVTLHRLLECAGVSDDGNDDDVDRDNWGWAFRRNQRSPIDADGVSCVIDLSMYFVFYFVYRYGACLRGAYNGRTLKPEVSARAVIPIDFWCGRA